MNREQAGPTAPKTTSGSSRLLAVDVLRGLLMALMALDHASHFVAQRHSSGEYWGGGFPVHASALSFVTRWVTHLCAPGFFFLMGIGMSLFADSRRRMGWRQSSVVRHFLTRGALLIGLQFLVENVAWELSPGGWGPETYIGVLFALGGAMILGSLLLWMRPGWLLALSAVLALASELVTPEPRFWGHAFPVLTRLLCIPGGERGLWVNYPVLPWLGLTCFGIALGRGLGRSARHVARWEFGLGAAFLVLFAVLRSFNGFGNIRPLPVNTWIGFLSVVKYPPSITFQLVTLGLNLILLGLLTLGGQRWPRLVQPLAVLGQVPLFFYVTHLFLYAALGRLLTPRGTSLPVMYGYWLLGLFLLLPVCLWYGRLRQRRPANSLLRFL